MYYNSNEYKNCNRGREQQEINNSQYLCCYPVGWSCDGYKGDSEKREESFYKYEREQKHSEKDFCGCNRHENWNKKECCCEKEQSFDFDKEDKINCHSKEEKRDCKQRRCCFCSLFNCFCKR